MKGKIRKLESSEIHYVKDNMACPYQWDLLDFDVLIFFDYTVKVSDKYINVVFDGHLFFFEKTIIS
jgi:hypothetical protein